VIAGKLSHSLAMDTCDGWPLQKCVRWPITTAAPPRRSDQATVQSARAIPSSQEFAPWAASISMDSIRGGFLTGLNLEARDENLSSSSEHGRQWISRFGCGGVFPSPIARCQSTMCPGRHPLPTGREPRDFHVCFSCSSSQLLTLQRKLVSNPPPPPPSGANRTRIAKGKRG